MDSIALADSNKNQSNILFFVLVFYISTSFLILNFLGLFCKFLSININVQNAIVTIFDVIPLFLYLIFFRIKVKLKNHINSLKFVIVLILFSLGLIGITFYNSSDFYSALNRIFVLFRFIPMALLILTLSSSKRRQIFKLFIILLYIFFFAQIFIGIVEIIGGSRLLEFFLPQTINPFATANLVIELNEIFGTFASTIEYSYTILLSYSILIIFKKIKFLSIVSIITLIVIYKSGSIACFGLFMYFIFLNLENSLKKGLIYGGMIFLCIAFFFLFEFQSFLIETYSLLLMSRLGILFFTLPEFLMSGLKNVLFGLGANQEFVYSFITTNENIPIIFLNDLNVVGLDDMYWVSTIVYSGVIGLTLCVYLFYIVFSFFSKIDYINKFTVKRLINFIFFAIIFGSFFNQVLHLRTFSYIFWILIGLFELFKIKRISSEDFTDKQLSL